MRIQRIAALVALATLTAVSLAGSMPKGVRSAYQSLSTTIDTCDFKKFQGYFGSDFTFVDPKGETANREQFMAQVKGLFDGHTSGRTSHKFSGVKEHDGVVDVSFEMHVTMNGPAGRIKVHEVGVDTWKQVNGKWVMIKTVDKVFDVKATKPKAKHRGTKGH